MDITKLYQTQISLTEWLERIGNEKAGSFRAEDNEKRERLKVLHDMINLPYDAPYQFSAVDIVHKTDAFIRFLHEHGSELCALRLIPLDPANEKLRMRGHTVWDSLVWFNAQSIDPAQYRADFVPHSEKNLWSTICIVNESGIFGEIIRGGHHQLTQGFYSEHKPIVFSYNWHDWKFSQLDPAAEQHLLAITRFLRVDDVGVQKILQERLQALFAHGYLRGYFETVTTEEFGIWFIDYNRLLGDMYRDSFYAPRIFDASSEQNVSGQSGSAGVVQGYVRIVLLSSFGNIPVDAGSILVCEMTTPEYLPLIQRSGGVVTDLGGILSHAAIVCRELGKPCIVGTKNATKILKDGDLVEVDGSRGVVRILKQTG